MKKTLIALAAVAATSAAFAQNVTISGRLDMGTLSNKTTQSETGYSATAKSSTLAGANGTKTGSRITFAGTEDLGGGLTAFFNIESSLNNSVIGNRNLFAGVRGDFGSVQIGRYLNTFSAIRDSHYSIAGVAGGAFLNAHLNVVNQPFVDDETIGKLAGYTPRDTLSTAEMLALTDREQTTVYINTDGDIVTDTTGLTAAELRTRRTAAEANATNRSTNAARAAQLRGLMGNGLANRSNNTLAYTSPSFGGFTVTAGLINDKIKANESDRAGETENKVNGQSVSLAYSAGPLAARLTTGSGKIRSSAMAVNADSYTASVPAAGTSSAKVSDTALMVSYDFGVAQAYVMNNRTKGELQQFRGAAINGTSLKTNATEIGAKMPMGNVEPFVTIGRGKIKGETGSVQSANFKTSAYQLGLNYNLSKRTSVYAATGETKLKLDSYTNKTTGYGVGIVHMF